MDIGSDIAAEVRNLLNYIRCNRRSESRGESAGPPTPRTAQDNVNFVGQNRGRYEKVEKLIWVGPGRGSVDLEEQPMVAEKAQHEDAKPWFSARSCVVGFVVLLVLSGTVGLVISVLQGPIASPSADSSTAAPRATTALGEDVAASGATFRSQCNADQVASWSEKKQMWCCEQAGLGCPESMCKAEYFGKHIQWAAKRSRWCCDFYGHGCDEKAKSSPAPAAVGVWQPLQQVPPSATVVASADPTAISGGVELVEQQDLAASAEAKEIMDLERNMAKTQKQPPQMEIEGSKLPAERAQAVPRQERRLTSDGASAMSSKARQRLL